MPRSGPPADGSAAARDLAAAAAPDDRSGDAPDDAPHVDPDDVTHVAAATDAVDAGPDHAPVPGAVRLGLGFAAGAYVLDQITKYAAESLLERGRLITVLGERVGLQLTYNGGGAFGLPAPSLFFLLVTVIVVVVVARNLPAVTTRSQAAAYGLLLAGAVGNATDRVVRIGGADDPRFFFGHVVDFLALELPLIGPFPRFNIADVAITTGLGLLILSLVLEERRHKAAAGATPGATT